MTTVSPMSMPLSCFPTKHFYCFFFFHVVLTVELLANVTKAL